MSVNDRCPSPADLGRELSTGPSAGTLAHLAACERCAREWASISLVASLARELPEPDLSDQDVESVRAALLGAASSAPARRGRMTRAVRFAAAAAAAAVLLAFAGYLALDLPSHDSGGPPAASAVATAKPEASATYRAIVHPHAGAEQVVVGAQPDEIVRLSEGTITVEVAPLAHGERFRVVTGDAEIEVRGTVFDVSVAGDLLVAVNVISGTVVVRPTGSTEVVLAAGDRWSRPPVPEPERPLPPDREAEHPEVAAARPVQPPVPEPSPGDEASLVSGTAAAAQSGSPQQQAFEEGWHALRSGRNGEAATAFERAATGADPIAEDAAFWGAVALSRAGAPDRARAALQAFIARFPGSTRSGEVDTMLGWMLLEAGRPQEAAARFRGALDDPSPRVRSSASKGLEAVESRR